MNCNNSLGKGVFANGSKIDTGKILISNSKFTAAENINAQAFDDSQSRSYILDAGNSFTADTLNFGTLNGSQTYSHTNGQAYLGLNTIIDDMISKTVSTAQVTIGNEFYNDSTTLNATALNKASRNSFMRNNAYSLVANANDISAYTKAQDNSIVTVGSRNEEPGTNSSQPVPSSYQLVPNN